MFTVTFRPPDTIYIKRVYGRLNAGRTLIYLACSSRYLPICRVRSRLLRCSTVAHDFYTNAYAGLSLHVTRVNKVIPNFVFFLCPETLLRKTSGGAGHRPSDDIWRRNWTTRDALPERNLKNHELRLYRFSR